ncbi:MAG: hypothetical protein CMB86_01760 [Flammeovirgaceae bacterium]|nr:hypothetical protein [Flammeovirgaceae bacterium]
MYLSKLQKFILNKSLNNLNNENLSINSDAIEKFTPNKEKKIDLINSSIDDLLEIKKNSEKIKKNQFKTRLGFIELDSNSHAHIYFYEPIVNYFGIKPKDKFIDYSSSIFDSMSDKRKKFEIKKRKYIRKEGNHKRGIIRGECKFLKRSKASLSRSFSSLVSKKLIRKISIINYESREIGIGFNLTEKGKKLLDEI